MAPVRRRPGRRGRPCETPTELDRPFDHLPRDERRVRAAAIQDLLGEDERLAVGEQQREGVGLDELVLALEVGDEVPPKVRCRHATA